MTTNNEERVRGFVNVYFDGPQLNFWLTKEDADSLAGSSRLRRARVVELRGGDSVVTRDMRAKIEQFTGSLWTAETRRAVEEILLILDGKDGQ